MRKVTEQEKEKWIEQENKKRNEGVIWETHELTQDSEAMLEELKNEVYTTLVEPKQDIDIFLNALRQEIVDNHKMGWSVSIIRIEIPPTN
jgi:adenosyl cobinamide kinase/adenosyl cobinamide phosphate guanylyltransferase|tara:strand:- start:282 stop:551 length:270 start_codon:yes stop_codon:yes gene_type:complete